MGDNLCASCPKPGSCCQYMVLPLARNLSADEVRYIELHPGVRVIFAPQPGMRNAPWGHNIRIDIACQHLEADGRCGIHGSPERPDVCNEWPTGPEQLVELPWCNYNKTFERKQPVAAMEK